MKYLTLMLAVVLMISLTACGGGASGDGQVRPGDESAGGLTNGDKQPDTAGSEPHFYAVALREYFADAEAFTAAVLADLDGDGIDEMVAVKQIEQVEAYGLPLAEFAIFDVKNEKITTEPIDHQAQVTPYSPTFYLSSHNHLIILAVPTEWYLETIFQYADGSLERNLLYYDWEGTIAHNQDEITQEQFDGYSVRYGSGSVKKLLWIGLGDDLGSEIIDETDQILSMTN